MKTEKENTKHYIKAHKRAHENDREREKEGERKRGDEAKDDKSHFVHMAMRCSLMIHQHHTYLQRTRTAQHIPDILSRFHSLAHTSLFHSLHPSDKKYMCLSAYIVRKRICATRILTL